MINFIKRGTSKVIKNKNIHNMIVCSIFTSIQQDIIVVHENKECFDIVKIAEFMKLNFIKLASSKSIKFIDITPLQCAEFYQIVLKGNSLLFLNNYQNYIGPIE